MRNRNHAAGEFITGMYIILGAYGFGENNWRATKVGQVYFEAKRKSIQLKCSDIYETDYYCPNKGSFTSIFYEKTSKPKRNNCNATSFVNQA